MSRQQRGGGAGEVARGAGYAALLGALLIGVAVVIGIVLLQIGDRNDNGPASATKPNPTTPTTTTTTTTPPTSTSKASSHPTTPKTPAIAPGVLKVIVLNGGAESGQAGVMASELRRQGYTSQDVANDWKGHHQRGNSVYCRTGLGQEGARLTALVGNNVPLHIPFPTPAPPFSAGRDCVVVVGSKT
jgi:LytR cell envelope-related transcriptional attenuator